MFNPNIGNLDPKIVSCHFIGYPERSKGYHFYYLDKHTKFVETRHAPLLEDQMIRGSMGTRKIDLEEKRVFVPTPMTRESYFSLPMVAVPTEQETAVPIPVISSPDVARNANEGPIPQNPIEPAATNEGEQQQPPGPEIPVAVAPQRPQRTRRSATSDDYEVYNSEEIQIEGDPTSFEEAMKSTNSSKWFAAMEDEMKSMSTNKVWDLEKIPK